MSLFDRLVDSPALAEMIVGHQQTAAAAKKVRAKHKYKSGISRANEPWTTKIGRHKAHGERRGLKTKGVGK